MAATASPDLGTIKKEKKEKKDKSAKKRAREEDAAGDAAVAERKHKKSKSVAEPVSELQLEVNGDPKAERKKSKKNKDRANKDEVEPEDEDQQLPPLKNDDVDAIPGKKEKKHKKSKHVDTNGDVEPSQESGQLPEAEKKENKRKKAIKHETEDSRLEDAPQHVQKPATNDPELMDLDDTTTTPKSTRIYAPSDMPALPQFPFFDQTVSLYEPLYPSGWAAPISGCESQHLRHLHNRYVPSLRGVLLDYSRVTLNDKPGRDGGATTDEEPTTLTSRTEFAGGFGWITADVRLFVPSRGAWMEGSVNLQTEGHIGVVCFGRFNASIEARRLPPTWLWVPNEQAETGFEETASVITAPDEHGVIRQIHSTGYWVDRSSGLDKIKGKIRFRIRNFDVGVTGDTTYLSLQGTMLDKSSEKALVAQEAKEARDRKQSKGGAGKNGRRRVPEFSMTRFAGDTEEEGQQAGENIVAGNPEETVAPGGE